MTDSGSPARLSRSAKVRAEAVVGRRLRRELGKVGFTASGAHLVRRTGGVTEVIEAQHSIYGSRVTANLGLDLEWLRPLIRWVPRPEVGPHAHDCIRWVRVGLVDGAGGDRWWPYDEDDPASLELAADGLTSSVATAGIDWMARERTATAFLRHAQKQLERSQTGRQPDGGYLELRLVAAVYAWLGDFERAESTCARASYQWEQERARLRMARKIYRRRHPDASTRLPPVPNLQRELERITAPTTGARMLRRAGALEDAQAAADSTQEE